MTNKIHLQQPPQNQQEQQQQQPLQLPRPTTTISTATVLKIPDLCPNMLTFFMIAGLGNCDTDPVPLCCQQNGINGINFFGLLSDTERDLVFQTYYSNGDSSGTRMQIMMRLMTQIRPAIKYCKFHFADKNNSDVMKPQWCTKDEYSKFYYAYCLDVITDSTITNATSDIGKANLIQLSI